MHAGTLQDLDGYEELQAKPSGTCTRTCTIGVSVFVAVLAAAAGFLVAYLALPQGTTNTIYINYGTTPQPQPPQPSARRYVLHVSLDGFRGDYFVRHAASCPVLHQLAARGIYSTAMQPSFPSMTFPNHYALATGLYPESHGVVANHMYDPDTGHTFGATSLVESEWWGGEPSWVTAVTWGLKSAVFYWPGSEASILDTRPTYYKEYAKRLPNNERVDGVLAWLALPEAERPSLLMMYMNDVDDAGHTFGPDSPEIPLAIARVDAAIDRLLRGIEAMNMTSLVNIIVTSDHGMTNMDHDHHTVYLDDHVNVTGLQIVDEGIVTALRPGSLSEDAIITALTGMHPNISVYRRADVPARFHYQAHRRIAPVVLVADEGWFVSSRGGRVNTDRGNHGYDNRLASMQAMFIAAGPGFVTGALEIPSFPNVNIYPLICYKLGIPPAPNNGSLHVFRPFLR